jgi:hypothetical protein
MQVERVVRVKKEKKKFERKKAKREGNQVAFCGNCMSHIYEELDA